MTAISFARLALLVLGLCLAQTKAAFSGDANMTVVIADPGKIMAGTKVLAEVPKGTRLWVFKVAPGNQWHEVKIPNQEQHGWVFHEDIEYIKLTAEQDAEINKANEHNEEFNKQKAANNFAAAQQSMERNLEICRRVLGEDDPYLARIINELGILAIDQGNYPAARKHFAASLLIRRKTLGNEHKSTADTLNNLGVLHRDQGDYATARKYYQEAIDIFDKLHGRENLYTAGTLDNMGVVFREQGDYSAARKCHEEALDLNRKILGMEHAQTANNFTNLGILLSDQGDYAGARKSYEAALEIYRKVYGSKHLDVASTLNNLGNLHRRLGDLAASKRAHEEALEINRTIGGLDHPHTADTLGNLGRLALKQKDYTAAQKYFSESLAIDRKARGNEHVHTAFDIFNLADLYKIQENYSAASKSYDEVLAIYRKAFGDHPSTADALFSQGDLAQLQHDFPVMLDRYDQCRRMICRHVRQTLPSLSEIEQLQFLDHSYREGWTDMLSAGWVNRNVPNVAARSASWLINGKAISQESLASGVLLARDQANPQLAPLVNELTAVRQQLAALALSTPKPAEASKRQATLAQLTADEQRLARTLAQSLGQATAKHEWHTLADVRATIPANALYVDLVRMALYDLKKDEHSPPHYLAWLIPAEDQGDIRIVDLGEAAPLEEALAQARASLAAASAPNGTLRQDGEAAAAAQVTRELHAVAKLALQPWLPQLAGKQQLILSPDGALWLLPWAALPSGENKCLLEQCSIRYITSGRDLVKTQASGKLGTNAPVIFANPNYNLGAQVAKAVVTTILPNVKFEAQRGVVSRSSLPQVVALPNTAIEALAAQPKLAKLAGNEPESYLEGRALEAVAKHLKRPKQLLFATHGFFLPDQEVKRDEKLLASSDTRALPALTTDGQLVENPLLRCGLLFAGCNAERAPGLDDGILTGMEIVGMDLRGTELVVLSACETGIGKVRNGEGVAGLRQAFQLAGAQSVVSTLWQVPDRDSALIMQDFFTNLAGGQSKADALRNAQLKRIAARKEKTGAAHPFFWAAWTVTGE